MSNWALRDVNLLTSAFSSFFIFFHALISLVILYGKYKTKHIHVLQLHKLLPSILIVDLNMGMNSYFLVHRMS